MSPQQELSLGGPDHKKYSRGSWGLRCGWRKRQVVAFLLSHCYLMLITTHKIFLLFLLYRATINKNSNDSSGVVMVSSSSRSSCRVYIPCIQDIFVSTCRHKQTWQDVCPPQACISPTLPSILWSCHWEVLPSQGLFLFLILLTSRWGPCLGLINGMWGEIIHVPSGPMWIRIRCVFSIFSFLSIGWMQRASCL